MGFSPPDLQDPLLIAAFEGWNDAGDSATRAVEHLALHWGAEPLAELDSEPYIDYQVNRPQVRLERGITRSVTWPTIQASICRRSPGDRDVVLLRGPEPNLRWPSFAREFMEFAEGLKIGTVITAGALLADTPHTRPTPVMGSTYSGDAAWKFGLQQSRYEGPTGIIGILHDACMRRGVPSISLWASVPHYISTPPNPKATLAILRRLEDVMELSIPLGALVEQAEEWEQQVTEMTDDDDEVVDYIRTLEEREESNADAAELPTLDELDAETLAADIEDFLQRRHGGEGESG